MNLGYEPQGIKIYLFGESVDMRKQMNGLIALVEGTYHMDPFEKALFLFTNKEDYFVLCISLLSISLSSIILMRVCVL